MRKVSCVFKQFQNCSENLFIAAFDERNRCSNRFVFEQDVFEIRFNSGFNTSCSCVLFDPTNTPQTFRNVEVEVETYDGQWNPREVYTYNDWRDSESGFPQFIVSDSGRFYFFRGSQLTDGISIQNQVSVRIRKLFLQTNHRTIFHYY